MCRIILGSWAREICGFDDGIRLDGRGMNVHKFDVGLARGKPFTGVQAERYSSDEGFGGGVERDLWDGHFPGERAVEDDENRVREGGFAERGEESAGEEGWEEGVPSDDREVIIFRPFLESEGSTDINTRDRDEHAWLGLTFWIRGTSLRRC